MTALLLALLASCAVTAAAPEVSLTVANHTGFALTGAPVRGGVPFPLGALADADGARLVDAGGRELPCRVRPSAYWHDGSVKWLLVDALVDIPAGGEAMLTLEPGAPSEPPSPRVEIIESERALSVHTGAARFEFSRTRFGLPSSAALDLDGRAGPAVINSLPGELVCEVEHQPPGPPEEENWLRDAAGGPRERFVSDPSGDYAVEVETANDLHAVIKLSGWLVNESGRRLMQYIIRAHACAGQPELRILCTLVYAGNPKEDFVRALYLRVPWSETGTDWALGGSRRYDGRLAEGESVSLWEIGPDKFYHLAPYTEDKTVRYTVSEGDRQLGRGEEAAGWARIESPQAAMTVAMRDFWQMHPKELAVDPQGITVYFWPERGGKVLDLRRRSDEIDNVYHYDLSMWEYGGEGVALTQEMLLRFDPPGADLGEQLVGRLNAPLRLLCRPTWYADTLAFGPRAVADPERYPLLEEYSAAVVEWMRANQRTFNWDGMIDYGDTLFHGYETQTHYGYVAPKSWGSRGYVGWLCNDGTLTHSLFMQAIRTGDYETLMSAEAMARHVMEVDTCHHCAAEPRFVGGGHRHDQQHWGNGVRGYGTATHGAIDMYLLTGDERALEVARLYARFHMGGAPVENEDQIGGLIRLWEITREPLLKQKADEILARELDVPEDSNWRFRTSGHFRFVSNTSVSLLAYLYSAPPEDAARLVEAIIHTVDHLEPSVMRSWSQIDYLPTILCALAYHHTGDDRYARMVAALLRRMAPPSLREGPLPGNPTEALRAMDFEQLVITCRRRGINNIYIANINGLCALPAAIAALQKAGLDEQAVWDMRLDDSPPDAFEEVLDPQRMSPERGFLYQCWITNGAPSDQGGGRSRLVLLEDGTPLPFPHTSHAEIREKGMGRYSHWGAQRLWFSTSDNSDPRANGREYRAVYPGPE